MKLIKSFGTLLLNVVIPFAFFVAGCIIISAVLALLGALSGHNTYQECFKGCMNSDALYFIMFLITFFIFLMHWLTNAEEEN